MNMPAHQRSSVFFSQYFLVALIFTALLSAQPAVPTGSLEGIATNATNGKRLERVLVTIEGTGLQTFSDADGRYRLSAVPAGEVGVRAFFTGFAPKLATLTLSPGQTLQHDIDLGGAPGAPGAGTGPLKLSEFVVGESREMTGAAIAINEQRFAANHRIVVAADQFGTVVDDNIGEIFKYLPGIEMVYSEGTIRSASINGVPNGNVPVTTDGFGVSPSLGTTRSVELHLASATNISRVEAIMSPTPESPGSALAGSVNMVTRSAFERTKPVFKAGAYLQASSDERTLRKMPDAYDKYRRKIQAGGEFSYTAPVNKRFGYSLSGSFAPSLLTNLRSSPGWRGARLATNGTTLPRTTFDAPYLTDYTFRLFPSQTDRLALGAALDFKLGDHGRLAFAFKHVHFENKSSGARQIVFTVNQVAPGNFSATHTHGSTGAGSVAVNNGNEQLRESNSYMPTLTYRHDGPVWKADVGLGLSLADTVLFDADRAFNTVATQRNGVTIKFDDIRYQGPGRITVTDGVTGAPIDYTRQENYALASVRARQVKEDGETGDITKGETATAYINLQREFQWRVPVKLKSGLNLERTSRDLRTGSLDTITFVGADGLASTSPVGRSDDGAGGFSETKPFTQGSRFGFPYLEFPSNGKLGALYARSPSYFRKDANTLYRAKITNSKYAEELISAAYLRGDLQFFRNRLKLIGGMRWEQTNIKAEGPLTDLTRNYQRDSAGRVLLGANGRPLPITNNALEISRLTLIDRGAKVDKEYLRALPSVNASYNVRENLIARAAYYHSLGRPDFNQYAGGLTLPDTELPPGPTNRITVNNAAIKAWSARSAKVSLEYYFQGVGMVSIGGYRRNFENFFGGTVLSPTPEFLAVYGLDESFLEYDVSTQYNLNTGVRMEGLEVSYQQALTFLPAWARGISVFANANSQRALGSATANFNGFLPRKANWGLSLSRPKYSLNLNFSYRGKTRVAQVTGATIEPGTFNWIPPITRVDFTAEYRLPRGLAVFLNVRDLTNSRDIVEVYGPSTPEYARLNTYTRNQGLWTLGLKGTF